MLTHFWGLSRWWGDYVRAMHTAPGLPFADCYPGRQQTVIDGKFVWTYFIIGHSIHPPPGQLAKRGVGRKLGGGEGGRGWWGEGGREGELDEEYDQTNRVSRPTHYRSRHEVCDGVCSLADCKLPLESCKQLAILLSCFEFCNQWCKDLIPFAPCGVEDLLYCIKASKSTEHHREKHNIKNKMVNPYTCFQSHSQDHVKNSLPSL